MNNLLLYVSFLSLTKILKENSKLFIFSFLFYFFFKKRYVYTCVPAWAYVHHVYVGVQGGQRSPGSLEMKLQAVRSCKHWQMNPYPLQEQ